MRLRKKGELENILVMYMRVFFVNLDDLTKPKPLETIKSTTLL